eukprot:scaffold1184_cov132-Cylindrotheca_fusiformis.AAC.17
MLAARHGIISESDFQFVRTLLCTNGVFRIRKTEYVLCGRSHFAPDISDMQGRTHHLSYTACERDDVLKEVVERFEH